MKKIVVGCVVGLALLVTVYFFLDPFAGLYSQEGDFASDEEFVVDKDSTLISHKAPDPAILYGIPVDGMVVKEESVKRNQHFSDLLQGYYLTPVQQQQLALVPRDIFDFRKISANKKYTVIAEADSLRSLRALVYEPNQIDYYVFQFGDSLRVEARHREVITQEKEIAGVIGSSLSETIEKLGISHELTNRFVDIFAWQVDFQRLQKGDRFKLFYEEQQVDGQSIAIGKILGVYFEHFNHPYYAVPFDQGDGQDYYDADGKSLRKALLKYPIEFTRISSRYNLKRFHPVAKVVRAHLGTDFAAPYGTPIRSVGDGIILEAQYKANNGNYVKIRHNGTYTTQYLHMSRIAAGMRPGGRVRQGQTIGFVGSTGLATGPHLCYRFWRNGIQVDALRVELPASNPVKKDLMTSFEEVRLRIMNRLDLIILPEPPVIVAIN